MPYIKSEDYARAVVTPKVPGELNYAITMKIIARLRGELTSMEFDRCLRNLTMSYLDRVGMSYTNGNAVIGVLDCAAREVRRRAGGAPPLSPDGVVMSPLIAKIERQLRAERKWLYDNLLAPYENVKIMENGDVYPKDLLSGG
ncbi:MAG: hypothetical protein V3R87_03595 [Dehalococcoidia bacterium]